MKTILSAKEDIAKLWGHPKPKDTEYRFLKYLLKAEVKDGLLLHNVVTGHLVLLSSEEARLLSQLPARPSEGHRELINDHFLVPKDFDEYRSVKQLRKILKSRSTGDGIYNYVILPTTFCNAHCFYCYESEYPRVHMTEETAAKLIDYIDKHRQGKDVTLNWFGGEPLVGVKRIDQITQGLMERGVNFKSSMISNGYLFDEEVIERSVKQWHLERVQITLDGTEQVYNRVKAYKSVEENPYKRVLANIDLLSEKKIHVSIRLNVDFYNKDDIRELIEELGKRHFERKYVSIYVNMLFNDVGYEPVHHSDSEMMRLAHLNAAFMERLEELGVALRSATIPVLQYSQCMADSAHTIEIQPDGSFCRCEHESILDSYGSLDKGITDQSKIHQWKETVERSEKCSECCLFPSCFQLKNCMNAEIPCVEEYRQMCENQREELLISVFEKSKEEGKHESL